MDPKRQECFGLYLYGAGYFARDQNTLGLVTGQNTPRHFCLECPRHASCEKTHEVRVRNDQPAAVAEYERMIRKAKDNGFSPLIAKLFLGKEGRDPFQATAIDNFNRGHADRGQASGLIVHSDADPRHS